jgi:hypothetical protein
MLRLIGRLAVESWGTDIVNVREVKLCQLALSVELK